MITRRTLLKAGGCALVAYAGAPRFLLRAAHAAEASGKVLVAIFQRGAVDGLSMVMPYGDSDYAGVRPSIGLQPPRRGESERATDLDGFFAFHPVLAPLVPLWESRALAVVHACGSPDTSRSHFDAQDYMESGTPGRKTTPDGWMNRLLAQLPGPQTPTSALSFGPTLPRIMAGRATVANVPLGKAAGRELPLDRPVINAAFDKLYSGDDALSLAYKEGIVAHKKVMTDLQSEMMEADNGAPSPLGFAEDTAHLARLIARDPTTALAFFALGG